MMTRLYIIRHAEAEGNLYRRCHGHYDGKITPNGHMQIEALRGHCANLRVDALYSSDLSRTRTTAGALEKKGLVLKPRAGLREIRLGVWEDMPWGQVMREYPDQYAAFSQGTGFRLEGAETCEQVRERMLTEVGGIVSSHSGQAVAIVSHGMAIRLLLCALSGLSPEEASKVPHLDNASVTKINWGDKPEIVKSGESSYLGELSTFSRQGWWREGGHAPDINLWFRAAAFPKDGQLAMAMKRAAWRSVYGTEDGFDESQMAEEAARHIALNPLALQFAMLGDSTVGLLQTAPDADCAPHECHITLFYLQEGFCGRGLGAQVLGEAVSVARKSGKTALRLRVWEKNVRALAFYTKHGFTQRGVQPGVFGDLLVMRKEV